MKNAKPKADAMAGKRELDDRDNQNIAKRRKTEDDDSSISQLSPAGNFSIGVTLFTSEVVGKELLLLF